MMEQGNREETVSTLRERAEKAGMGDSDLLELLLSLVSVDDLFGVAQHIDAYLEIDSII